MNIKKRKKMLTIFLVILLVFQVFTSSVFAENETNESTATSEVTTESSTINTSDTESSSGEVTEITSSNENATSLDTQEDSSQPKEIPSLEISENSDSKENSELETTKNESINDEGALFNSRATNPLIVKVRNLHDDTVYVPGSSMTYEIFIDATPMSVLQLNNLSGAYVEVRMPSTFILRTGVMSPNHTDLLKSSTWTIDGEEAVLRINLIDLNSTINGSINVETVFKPRVTPDKYVLEPVITVYNQDGNPIANTIVNDLDKDSVLRMSTKYEQKLTFNKMLHSNTTASTSADGQLVYGGAADTEYTVGANNLTYIGETASDVTFMFSPISDSFWNSSYSHNGVNGRYRLRLMEEIKLTDTLPTYADKNGVTRTAVFEPDKNPGWINNGNGTVSYSVKSISDDPETGGADRQLNQVKLVLSFPGAPSIANVDGKITNVPNLTNTIAGEMIPYNESSHEKAEREKPTPNYNEYSDSITFKMQTEPFNAKGLISKGTRFYPLTFPLDKGGMHLSSATFDLSISNKNASPLTNLVWSDYGYEKDYYIKNITFNFSTENIKEIVGIAKDGTETRLVINATTKSVQVDTETEAGILQQVKEYEAALIAGQNPEIPLGLDPKFTRVEIRFKDEFKLAPGAGLAAYVTVGFAHPYQLEDTGGKATMPNYTSLEGDLILNNNDLYHFGKDDSIKASSSLGLKTLAKAVAISKYVINNGASPGSGVHYRIALSLSSIGKNFIFNDAAYIVDVLPLGLKYTGWRHGPNTDSTAIESVTAIENYHNSGRTGILFKFKPGAKVGEMSSNTIHVDIFASITSEATNAPNINQLSDDNLNHTYFTMTGLDKIMQDQNIVNKSELPDQFDVDADGNVTEMAIGAKVNIVVTVPAAVQSRKFIRKGTSTDYALNWSTTGIETQYGANYQYKLEVFNNGAATLNKLSIYDVMPFEKDKFYNSNLSRGSGFRDVLTGPIVLGEPAKFSVKYHTLNVSEDPNVGVVTQGWLSENQVTDWSKVTSFLITMNDGSQLPVGGRAIFYVNAKAPIFKKGTKFTSNQANNNFAVSYDGDSWGQSNTVYNKLLQQFDVEKVWSGFAGDEVNVRLLQNGKPYQVDLTGDGTTEDWVVKLNALSANDEGAWTETFYDLPSLDDKGKPYIYTVDELAITYFEKDEDGNILLDDETGKPKIAKTTSLNASDYDLAQIPTMNGNLVVKIVLNNTFKSPKIPIKVDLSWLNGEQVDKPSVKMELKRVIIDELGNKKLEPVLDGDGQPVVVTINPGHSKADFGDQPVFNSDGTPTTYTVVQTGLDGTDWKEKSITEITPTTTTVENEDGTTTTTTMTPVTYAEGKVKDTSIKVVNEYTPPLINVDATKIYVGGNNFPEVYFQLYRNIAGETAYIVPDETPEEPVEPVELEEPEEPVVPDTPVDADIPVDEDTPVEPEDPAPVEPKNLPPKRIFDNKREVKVTWENMPKTDLQGNPYIYSVKEVDENGEDYVPENYTKSGEGTLQITNTYVSPKTEFTVEKVWLNGAEEKPSVELTLYRKLSDVSGEVDSGFKETITLTDKTQSTEGTETWLHTWTGLDLTDENATLYYYYATEETVPAGFNKVSELTQEIVNEPGEEPIEGEATDETTEAPVVEKKQKLYKTAITNEYIVPLQDITVEKKWENGNSNNRKPVALQLERKVADGEWEKVEQITLDGKVDEDGDGNVWTYTWKGVPQTNLEAKAYIYKVNETIVPDNYTASYSEDGLTVTNSYASPKIEKTAIKQWIGGPAEKPEITIVLWRENAITEKSEVARYKLSSKDALIEVKDGVPEATYWGYTFTDLDLTDLEENEYTYSITEASVPQGYKSEIIPESLTVVNSYVLEPEPTPEPTPGPTPIPVETTKPSESQKETTKPATGITSKTGVTPKMGVTPKTGEVNYTTPLVILSVALATILLVIRKRKQKQKQKQ